ncbi:hypothetical protein BpHYR1_015032 [Brachionus plicatilis]|uniref:Uncharacterized protein n=1 Tax=Brachionus plicatilis TaxID=10195 RepID=A0A3M7QIC8_BRAPC|nr:hypothetical protein BpHYR1_015032 [Brachionus plicatilis]
MCGCLGAAVVGDVVSDVAPTAAPTILLVWLSSSSSSYLNNLKKDEFLVTTWFSLSALIKLPLIYVTVCGCGSHDGVDMRSLVSSI